MLLIHGDNQIASRRRLTDLLDQARTNGQEIILLAGETLTFNQTLEAVGSVSLFGLKRLIVIENIISCRNSVQKNKIIDYLNREDGASINMVIWERRLLPQTQLKFFSRAKIEVFKTPALIFKFLDSIRPGNKRQVLAVLADCKRVESAELIFYMLAKRLRKLILAKAGMRETIGGASWQIGRIVTQSRQFGARKLNELYRQMLEIDWLQKTGQDGLSLSQRLDLLIMQI